MSTHTSSEDRTSDVSPKQLKVFEWLGFTKTSTTEDQYIGTCPFCDKGKFYINTTTYLWDCKTCARSGNISSFVSQHHAFIKDRQLANPLPDVLWNALSVDRGIPVEVLQSYGILHYGSRWLIPIYNEKCVCINYRIYTPKRNPSIIGLPHFDPTLFGGHLLAKADLLAEVFVCEGEWDVMCLNDLFRQAGRNAYAVGVPGAGTFPTEWCKMFENRHVVLCFDNDDAGRKGASRIAKKLREITRSVRSVTWPAGMPDGYDIRDFYFESWPLVKLISWIDFWNYASVYDGDEPVQPDGAESEAGGGKASSNGSVHGSDTSRRFRGAQKCPFQSVIEAYKKHLYLTPNYEMAIRVAYATVLSEQMPGDPLWVYLIAPPSSGKTVILASLEGCMDCRLISNATPKTFVSGFRTMDGRDPSLIPQLQNKTLVMKDFTEVLNMHRATRDELYAILRGAYDGDIQRPYANGVYRSYSPHFSFLAGVTQSIYAERSASLGERFLMLHIIRNQEDNKDEETIIRALDNVGRDHIIGEDLRGTAGSYLNTLISVDEVTVAEASMNQEFNIRLASLSQLVGMLRGQVERDGRGETLLYRPQYEMGARLAKQLKKMGVALCLLEDEGVVNERVYKILVRIAFDTCIGFHLEIVQALSIQPQMDIEELNAITDIPLTTLRHRLDDMLALNIIERVRVPNSIGRGALLGKYSLHARALRLWNAAHLDEPENIPSFMKPVPGKKHK